MAVLTFFWNVVARIANATSAAAQESNFSPSFSSLKKSPPSPQLLLHPGDPTKNL
jgi:hypothetical protein